MAVIIGGTRAFPGRDNRLIGTGDPDIIFGDRFTDGVGDSFLSFRFPDVPEIGGALSAGTGGDDRIEGRGTPGLDNDDVLFGDAFEMTDAGKGGRDVLLGGVGGDELYGDAFRMFGAARGGDDRLATGRSGAVDEGEGGSDDAYGDASEMYDETRGGDDELLGGPTEGSLAGCRLRGDALLMDGDARGGDDTLLAGAATDFVVLVGDASTMAGSARGGRDRLVGGDAGDFVFGDAGDMSGDARGGDDRLRGARGNDRMFGDAGRMSDSARGGGDRLAGGQGNDELFGDGGAVVGAVRCGADTLDGGKGDDLLYGDLEPASSSRLDVVRGVDTFVFRPGDGRDTIGDFEVGRDRIVLLDPGPLDLARIPEAGDPALARGGRGDTVLDLGAARGGPAGVDTLTLVGVTDLRASDFVIA